MKAIDIINYASKNLLKRSIAPEDGVAWINDCLLMEIKKNAHVFSEIILNDCEPKQRYDFSSDYIAVHSVYDEREDIYTGWVADETQIVFADKGSYTVRYHRIPATIAIEDVNTAEPDCHPLLHQTIPYYLAYRFFHIDFPADKETEIRYMEFQAKLNGMLSQMQKRTRIMKTSPWR